MSQVTMPNSFGANAAPVSDVAPSSPDSPVSASLTQSSGRDECCKIVWTVVAIVVVVAISIFMIIAMTAGMIKPFPVFVVLAIIYMLSLMCCGGRARTDA